MSKLQYAGIAAVVVIALSVAGWAFGPWGATTSPDELLVVDGGGTVQLIDAETGSARFSVPDAVVSRDRSSLFTTTAGVGSTHVESRDATTGKVTGVTTVAGDLEIRVVSPDAGAIALMGERAGDLDLYEPVPRASTSITVAYTDERPAQVFDLEGNYEPETFSLDEETLYLLEFQPPTDPEYYLVREMDLATGEVEGVKTPQVDLRPEMRGVARAQQVAPEGAELYTLYSIPSDEEPVHDTEATGDSERWAFVHVLDLELGVDICIFLPTPMGEVAEESIGLGLSPDGSTLWVVDPASSMIARIDVASRSVVSVHDVPQLGGWTGRAEVAAADDGTVYVALGNRLLEFAPESLVVSGAWSSQTENQQIAAIDSVSVSSDGEVVRYGSTGRIVLITRRTGDELAVLEGPDGSGLTILGPPTGTAIKIPLQCVC